MNPFKWIDKQVKSKEQAMLKDVIFGFIRHGLTALGGAAMTKGLASGNEVNDAIGAVMILAGLVWSAIQKAQISK